MSGTTSLRACPYCGCHTVDTVGYCHNGEENCNDGDTVLPLINDGNMQDYEDDEAGERAFMRAESNHRHLTEDERLIYNL